MGERSAQKLPTASPRANQRSLRGRAHSETPCSTRGPVYHLRSASLPGRTFRENVALRPYPVTRGHLSPLLVCWQNSEPGFSLLPCLLRCSFCFVAAAFLRVLPDARCIRGISYPGICHPGHQLGSLEQLRAHN